MACSAFLSTRGQGLLRQRPEVASRLYSEKSPAKCAKSVSLYIQYYIIVSIASTMENTSSKGRALTFSPSLINMLPSMLCLALCPETGLVGVPGARVAVERLLSLLPACQSCCCHHYLPSENLPRAKQAGHCVLEPFRGSL